MLILNAFNTGGNTPPSRTGCQALKWKARLQVRTRAVNYLQRTHALTIFLSSQQIQERHESGQGESGQQRKALQPGPSSRKTVSVEAFSDVVTRCRDSNSRRLWRLHM